MQEAAGLGLPSHRGGGLPLVASVGGVRVGITLPQFRHEADPSFAVAHQAEAAGLDGVFVFDHLWPLRQPERPALHGPSLLAALAVETDRVVLGPLVARVGLLPDALLVHSLLTIDRMLGERFVATLGTGDSSNRDDNLAYGVSFPPKAERLTRLVECCRRLRCARVRTWVCGNSADVRSVAVSEADGWNGWGSDTTTFAAQAAGLDVEVSWGGQVLLGGDEDAAAAKLEHHGMRPGLVHGTVADLVKHFEGLADAGATWAVCAPLDIGVDAGAVELVAEAAAAVQ